MRMRTALVLILAMLGGRAAAQPAPDAPLRVGLAERDITAPVGYRLDGYFNERLATGTKDPLLAKAAVFAQGGTTFALVVTDLLGMPRSMR